MEFWRILYLYVLLFICAVTDIREKKIKNTWIVAMLAGGILFLIGNKDSAVFLESVLTMFVLFFLFFPLYIIRIIGAGDVKLIGVTALYIGRSGIRTFLLVTFFIAGCFAFIKLLYYHNLTKRIKYFVNYIKKCLLTREIGEYGIPREKSEVIGLGLPVLGGAVGWYMITVLEHM